jgi:hypothetical protein
MAKQNAASVQIIINADGVERVRLCGRSWDDEESAMAIYKRISHFIREIEVSMKESPMGVSAVT